jgi:hypothetical protein
MLPAAVANVLRSTATNAALLITLQQPVRSPLSSVIDAKSKTKSLVDASRWLGHPCQIRGLARSARLAAPRTGTESRPLIVLYPVAAIITRQPRRSDRESKPAAFAA